MHNKLKMILASKQQHVAELKADAEKMAVINQLLSGAIAADSNKNFAKALRVPGLSVIAEIKRRSPSRGDLAEIANPTELADRYAQSGAAAVSVLTDPYFSGTLADLQQVTAALQLTNTCVLRKDFIIDAVQIAEAVLAGADAVLLIVAVLQGRVVELLQVCKQLGIAALVEVHSSAEIDLAVAAGAEIIGVNNRNLVDFTVDTQLAINLVNEIPADKVRIAESGIFTAEQARQYQQVGYDAVLVGEALVTAENPAELITAFRGEYA